MSIEVRNLQKAFGQTVVCDHLNLDIPAGELVALLGPSGSGKTTLLRILAGLEVPDAGSVLFHGEDTTSTDVRERNVGFVFQHYALFAHMSIFENVAFGLRVKPATEVVPGEKQCRWCSKKGTCPALKAQSLTAFESVQPAEDADDVVLAKTLAKGGNVLMLDEPSAGLSPLLVQQVFERLRLVRESGVAILLVEQNVKAALGLADSATVLVEGRDRLSGPAADLAADPRLKGLYLGEAA
jgi:sulfate transport system ATP-binding protein